MRDDRGRPVDGVDLRHQGRVHEPRLVVELLVGELGMARRELVADRVVLAHEERVEERQADPEVAGDPAQVDVRFEILRWQPLLVDPQLPLLAGAQPVGESLVAPIDLRPVPPVRVVGDEGQRLIGVGARVGVRARDLHRVIRPRVVLLERNLPRVVRLDLAVAEPVVDLELDPRAREQVQGRCRLELLAREQLTADETRARVEHRVGRLPVGVGKRHVAPETTAEAAHERIVEVVEGSVERPCGQVTVVIRHRRHVERPAPRVVEVFLP